jgi:hypothetical protein
LYYRQPSLWNNLMFHLRGIPTTLTFLRFNMNTATIQSNSRRNTLVRTVTALVGDIAAGAAMAAACVWLIEAATLGLFLSFLVWLIGSLLALALSQFVVHPAVAVLLSDRKLDQVLDGASGLSHVFADLGADLGRGLDSAWQSSSLSRRWRPA